MNTLMMQYITTLFPPSSCMLQYGHIIAHQLPVLHKVVGKTSRVDADTVWVISTTLHCKAMHCVVTTE